MREMLNKRRNRAETGEEGFTLIELMVVVLIIGILLAIAVPTFLNAQKNAKSKAATSNLRSALSAAKTVYADKQTYATASITVSALREAEPSLTWAASSASPETIGFAQGATTEELILAVRSKNGDCFYLRDNVGIDATTAGTWYARDTAGPDPCVPVATFTASTNGDNAYTKVAADGWK